MMNSSSDLQICYNAAFHGENTNKMSSWSSLKQDFLASSDHSTKENGEKSPVAVNAPPLQPTGNSDDIRDEKKIDSEIEEIQKEINKLTSTLDALRLEKAERKIKALQKLGRMVPAKFMDQKKNVTKMDNETKINQRRGLTMGPSEISAGFRRGVSMGPAEIFLGTTSRQLRKQQVVAMITPPGQDRRKSCFWKLEDVDEKRAVTKERASSFTVGPKWQKETTKNTPDLRRRQAATAVGSKKPVKKEEPSIQPKTLFRDGDTKSLPMRKPPGRVVASRYNPLTSKNRSLPENETNKKTGEEKMVSSPTGNSIDCLIAETACEEDRLGYGMRKKRRDIPSKIVIRRNVLGEISPVPLPMIKTVRLSAIDTPRDSGPAKRVVDLVGRKKSYFCNDDEEEDLSSAVPKALNFEEWKKLNTT